MSPLFVDASLPGRLRAAACCSLVAAMAAGGGCVANQPRRTDPLARALAIASPDDLRLEHPDLAARIGESPHAYFRFVNQAFGALVCRSFEQQLAQLPRVILHGDPHLGQYVVTGTSRGLSDYDDAAVGPYVIDTVRFKTSLILAARQRGWAARTDAFVEAFEAGYAAALAGAQRPPAPRIAEQIRTAAVRSHLTALRQWTNLLRAGRTLDPRDVEHELAPFATVVLRTRRDMSKRFFAVKEAALVRLGIGSALSLKALVRVEGPTSAAEDDLILEAKEVNQGRGVPCVSTRTASDQPLIILNQARIAYAAWSYTGFATWRIDGREVRMWIHEWEDSYRELAIADLARIDDLLDLSYDIGYQLARGHTNVRSAERSRLRTALLHSVRQHRAETDELAHALADATTQAWRAFRRPNPTAK